MMEMTASKKYPWHVVILGRWNAAILSPHGITKRLFSLKEKEEFQLYVAIDGVSPLRVGYGGVTVSVLPDRLVVESEKPEYSNLERAMQIAKRAIEELPQTPLTAAGINVQLTATTDSAKLLALFDDAWAAKLGSFTLHSRTVARAIKWMDGEVNTVIQQRLPENFEITCNFNRESTDAPELQKWLSLPIKEVHERTEEMLSIILD